MAAPSANSHSRDPLLDWKRYRSFAWTLISKADELNGSYDRKIYPDELKTVAVLLAALKPRPKALTPDEAPSAFVELLRRKGSPDVLEIGPGGRSLVARLAVYFQKAGCKLAYAGDAGNDLERVGMAQISNFFSPETVPASGRKFGIVIAKKVFSYGGLDGHTSTLSRDEIERLVSQRICHIANVLSPNAIAVLYSDWSGQIVRRPDLEAVATIHHWQYPPTPRQELLDGKDLSKVPQTDAELSRVITRLQNRLKTSSGWQRALQLDVLFFLRSQQEQGTYSPEEIERHIDDLVGALHTSLRGLSGYYEPPRKDEMLYHIEKIFAPRRKKPVLTKRETGLPEYPAIVVFSPHKQEHSAPVLRA